MEHAHWHLVMVFALLLVGLIALPVWSDEPAAVQRGKAVLQAAGGCSCHTDDKHSGAFLAGGRPIKTPFGTIYSTNITPAPKTGIGTWSEADFHKAMTQGVGPDGKPYFPIFPYTSFTRMTAQDVRDLKAYLFSIPPVEQANKPPELRFPFGWRTGLVVWRWLNFRPGTFQSRSDQSAEWNRGAYLVTALGHCAECHTPRNWLGGLRTTLAYAGSVDGPEGELAPNITPDEATGIGKWNVADIVWFLQTGLKPDGDDTQGLMSVVIENGYKHLPEADLRAIAVYLRSLPPIRHKVVKKDK
jgi:mono/diheme cytochrome c family protein